MVECQRQNRKTFFTRSHPRKGLQLHPAPFCQLRLRPLWGREATLPLVPVVPLALNHRLMATIPPGSGIPVTAKSWADRFISFLQVTAYAFRQVRISEPVSFLTYLPVVSLRSSLGCPQ